MSSRRFVPTEIWGDKLQIDKLERHEPKWHFVAAPCQKSGVCRCCGFHKPCTEGAIIVAIDNACREVGTETRAAFGVYFSISSPFNVGGLLPKGCRTDNRAELATAIEAFRAIAQMCALPPPAPRFGDQMKQLIIKTSSDYVVTSMVMHVEHWRRTGFRDSRGFLIKNADLLRSLDNLVCDVEKAGPVDVRFWLVSSVQNKQAQKLASAVLDGVDYKRFTKDDFFGEAFECLRNPGPPQPSQRSNGRPSG